MQPSDHLPRLRWAGPTAIAYLGLLSGLTTIRLLQADLGAVGGLAWALLAAVVGCWALELSVVRLPTLLLAAATALSVECELFLFDDGVAPLFLLLLLVWTAYTKPRQDNLVALAVSLATLVPWYATVSISVPWTIGIVATWVMLQAMVTQHRTLMQLRAAQQQLTINAAAAERQRIAQEIHDVVAHSLAVTMLHVTGARHILERDPRRASEALAQAEQLGRQSLADVRRSIGLLRHSEAAGFPGTAIGVPLPSAADVARLVADYADAGMDVHISIAGDPQQITGSLGLAVYRIAQEALANAARHAAGATTEVALTIDAARNRVQLRVRDRGAVPVSALAFHHSANEESGMGLPGMRKRAEMLGGVLFAGPDPSGTGWLVECTLPTGLSGANDVPGGKV